MATRISKLKAAGSDKGYGMVATFQSLLYLRIAYSYVYLNYTLRNRMHTKKNPKKAAMAPPPKRKKAVPARERRSYRQYCGLAKAMDALGERWTLLIARDLMLGPRRYGDIRKGLEGLTTNLLAGRLKEMEAAGIIVKEKPAPPSRGYVYALTPAGRDLEPVLLALGKWGFRYMEKPSPLDKRDLAWGLFALKRHYRGVTLEVAAELRAGDRVFQYRLDRDYADLREGAVWMPDFSIGGDAEAFVDLCYRGKSYGALAAERRLQAKGSETALRAFLEAFGLAV